MLCDTLQVRGQQPSRGMAGGSISKNIHTAKSQHGKLRTKTVPAVQQQERLPGVLGGGSP